jgi:S1-C subfamily serine protease
MLIISGIALLVGGCGSPQPAASTTDLSESFKQSLVYLEITNSGYDQYQPWRQAPISKDSGFGCAVSPYEILTTAENVMNASLVQIRCYAQNEWIPASVKVIDYEYNLALLQLEEKALKAPLQPITFTESYPRGKEMETWWLSSGNQLTSARSTLDRAEMRFSDVSFVKHLFYLATNISRPFGDGEVCFYDGKAIGMPCWGIDSDAGIIPAEMINRFLSEANKETYIGFGQVGFAKFSLLDPLMRQYLKMPPEMDYGMYVSTVYNLGTGSEELKPGDVILSVDGHKLNPYGHYKHPLYDRISFEDIILRKNVGDVVTMKIWRDAQQIDLDVATRSFKADQMLIPYYIYGKQPEYVVLGGFVFQNLTRDYLTMWGEGWTGKCPPHLYHYYIDQSFKPSEDRQNIVVLNYVLPTESNLGYQKLSRLIVESVNGKKVSSLQNILNVAGSSDDSEFLVFEFETDTPKVVLKKSDLMTENMKVAQMYGIPKLSHIE